LYKVKEINNFRKTLCSVFFWSRSLTVAQKVIFASGLACLTGLSAQIRFSLPFTPVPITMQTFFVLLAGVILGRNWGGISQALYVGAGILGVQWFSGGIGGYELIFGPTGGYLIGFVLAAFFLGYATDKYFKIRNFSSFFLLMGFTCFFLIYIPGLVQLGFYFYMIKGTFPGVMSLLTMGLFPFVPGEIVKILLASLVAAAIVPEEG